MRLRSLLLAMSFVFLTAIFSPALCQESPESKANHLLAQLYSLPNFPKLAPVKIRIDRVEKDYVYYLSSPKRFFGLKTSSVPEIHLSENYVRLNTDDSILVTLAHELGHHFQSESELGLYFEPPKPLDLLIKRYEITEKGQYFAEAFALCILGEDLFRKGRMDEALVSYKKQGVYWLYVETNPQLYKYYMDQAELWVNYWTDGAKSGLDEVAKRIKGE